jgi:hypothetical protein
MRSILYLPIYPAVPLEEVNRLAQLINLNTANESKYSYSHLYQDKSKPKSCEAARSAASHDLGFMSKNGDSYRSLKVVAAQSAATTFIPKPKKIFEISVLQCFQKFSWLVCKGM